ncbi:GNAT family N-acetyltransferase [Streptomyces atriruber]|uniref:GNAT family N-acetyltransferase n=1 Tax=Streptomyces atriruber TaxID=545121 RepID=UPI0006E3DA53|nr:GNAT family N-acetyltransferase [Streptomyces atriruber]
MTVTVNLTVEPAPGRPGLTLRPWTARDVPALLAAHRDPDLRRWLVLRLESAADAHRWVGEQHEAWAAGTWFSFAVLETDGDTRTDHPVVGNVVLKAVPDGSRPGAASEVGYWTAPEARGKGVAPRALEAVSRWAFASLTLAVPGRLELLHAAANENSCRVARKSGYAFHSVLPPFPPDYPGEGHLHVRVNNPASQYT